MIETFQGYVAEIGLPVILAATFLSCLAVPIPTFAVMLTGGAFSATGDLVLSQVLGVAYLGALAGDQTGFQIGRRLGRRIESRLASRPARAQLVARARAIVSDWGGTGVFFSTWLFAPLGPWVNLTAGAARMNTLRFTLWDAAGEAIWVTGYVGLGYAFGTQLPALIDVVGNWAGVASSGGITVILGIALARAGLKRRRQARLARAKSE